MESTAWQSPRAEFRAADLRRIARDKLRGSWLISAAMTFVATILGAFLAFPGSVTNLLVGTDQLREFYSRIFEPLYGSYGEATAMIDLALSAFRVSAVTGAILGMAIFVVGSPVALGYNGYFIDLCSNRQAGFPTMFSRFSILLKSVGLKLFLWVFTFLWSLLLLFPGIIAMYRYSMAPFLMAQYPEMGIREAVRESKRLMSGHKWRLFCLNLSFLGWMFLSIFTLGLGVYWLTPYVQAATAAFYLDRTGQGIPLNVK